MSDESLKSAESAPLTGPQVWDRDNQTVFTEKVFGGELIDFLYTSPIGKAVERAISFSALPSRLYGHYQSTARSRKAIPEFIRKFGLDMDEYEPADYASFNDFFIRKFRAGARSFVAEPTRLPAPCEGRYLFIDSLDEGHRLNVKNASLDPTGLIGRSEVARDFIGGPATICRLCPVDYHRFHFPDAGRVLQSYRVGGALHSVNPRALEVFPDLFLVNERHVTILDTENFGKIAYIEVGAICVGKIVQSHDEKKRFARGDEKGYFLFGGSTVVMVGQKGAWRWDEDLRMKSAEPREVYIKIGRAIGTKG